MKWKTKINHPLVLRIEGQLLLIEGLFMLTVLPVTYLYHGLYAFSMPFSALITLLTGIILLIATRNHKDDKTTSRDGVYVVCISWLVLSLFGAIPFLLSKSVPNFTDGFFEALSGFTTTGATILTDIESVPKDILLWRSMTQWIGGLAIIVFSLAILPYLGMSGMQLFVSEINGITYDKLHPRVMHTVRRIWFIYLFFTLLETLLLYRGDMDFYDALCHSLSTISSGGFSTRTANVGAFSNYSQVVITVFMVLSGCNFSLLLLSLSWSSFTILKNQEFRTYLLYTVFLGIAIGLVLFFGCHKSFGSSFRESFFSVISAFTTTGFFVSDYTAWPTFLWVILFLLMFIGACSGSTSGGVKIFRHLIFTKNSQSHLHQWCLQTRHLYLCLFLGLPHRCRHPVGHGHRHRDCLRCFGGHAEQCRHRSRSGRPRRLVRLFPAVCQVVAHLLHAPRQGGTFLVDHAAFTEFLEELRSKIS